MKKIFVIVMALLITLSLVIFLNMEVTTGQGVGSTVTRLKLPLYLKVFNFYNRHLNYKWLVRRVVGNLDTTEEKVFRLFRWTYQTIHRQPKGLPVMDDHVWNIYIRRYGGKGNFNDLFTTLCNYIETSAYSIQLYNSEGSKNIQLAAVLSHRGWVIFDPWKGVYFVNEAGDWATIDEIKNKNWKIKKLEKGADTAKSYYEPYLEKMPVVGDVSLGRSNIQSPVNRFKYQTNKWLSGEIPLFE